MPHCCAPSCWVSVWKPSCAWARYSSLAHFAAHSGLAHHVCLVVSVDISCVGQTATGPHVWVMTKKSQSEVVFWEPTTGKKYRRAQSRIARVGHFEALSSLLSVCYSSFPSSCVHALHRTAAVLRLTCVCHLCPNNNVRYDVSAIRRAFESEVQLAKQEHELTLAKAQALAQAPLPLELLGPLQAYDKLSKDKFALLRLIPFASVHSVFNHESFFANAQVGRQLHLHATPFGFPFLPYCCSISRTTTFGTFPGTWVTR